LQSTGADHKYDLEFDNLDITDMKTKNLLQVFVVAVLVTTLNIGAAQPVYTGAPQTIDDSQLPGDSIDDFTEHTYSVSSGGIGSVADCEITRIFSDSIESLRLFIESGQADDIGYVGDQLVTNIPATCAPVGVVLMQEVTSQVTISGDSAKFTLRAKENCCCVTGWGTATAPDRLNAKFHWVVKLKKVKVTIDVDETVISNVGVGDSQDLKRILATSQLTIKTDPLTTDLLLKVALKSASPATDNTGLFYDRNSHVTDVPTDNKDGTYTLFYQAKPEEKSNKCNDDPVLSDQTIVVEVTLDGKSADIDSLIVKSRHNYLINYEAVNYPSLSINYHLAASSYAIKKYELSGLYGFSHYYNETLKDHVGIWAYITNKNEIVIGEPPYQSESCLASTFEHELVHSEQAPLLRTELSQGKQAFLDHNGDLNPLNYSKEERKNIYRWAVLEFNAFARQDTNSGESGTCVIKDSACYSAISNWETNFYNLSKIFEPYLRIEEMSASNQRKMNFYPNPTSGQFTLQIGLDLPDGVARFDIINIVGQSILSDYVSVANGILNKEIEMNSSLPDGMYLVRVMLNDRVFSGQLILQR
jgi:hypothetical protein